MELPPLTAGVRGCRQLSEQGLIIGATSQRRRDLTRIDADESGPEAIFDHTVREATCILAPDWEDAGEACWRHLLFTVLADILQEEIPERHSLHAALLQLSNRFPHASLVYRIDALGRDPNLVHRQSKRRGLPPQ